MAARTADRRWPETNSHGEDTPNWRTGAAPARPSASTASVTTESYSTTPTHLQVVNQGVARQGGRSLLCGSAGPRGCRWALSPLQ